MLTTDPESSNERETSPRPSAIELIEHMHDFIQGQGGEVRYDVFANEHLHGPEHGFYSVYADISSTERGEVPTPSSSNPAYRECLAGFILSFVTHPEYGAAALKSGEGPPTIVEIGGGGGELKSEILTQAAGEGIYLDYISVDPNPNHRKAQEVDGTSVVAGSVAKLPFEDGSIDMLFSEEVLDCLPMRVLKWDARAKRIPEEMFVRAVDGALQAVWRPVDPHDQRIGHSEHDLGQRGYDKEIYLYVPEYWDYLIESARILRPRGIQIACDYGYVAPEEHFLAPGELGHVKAALQQPYQRDLTHFVDFWQVHKLARIQSNYSPLNILSLGDLFANVSQEAAIQGLHRFAFVGVRTESELFAPR